jgi:hypothetical protein
MTESSFLTESFLTKGKTALIHHYEQFFSFTAPGGHEEVEHMYYSIGI